MEQLDLFGNIKTQNNNFKAIILCDSLADNGCRLTTIEVTYPRIIHAEMLRHRVKSRSAASSRAIPVQKFIEQVENDPYVPTHWGKNQKGMQAYEVVDKVAEKKAKYLWIQASKDAVMTAKYLVNLGIHKQVTNRLLEPFQWMTEVITATEWDNFFSLRCHEAAHPDIQTISNLMRQALETNTPKKLNIGEWHLPLIDSACWGFSSDIEVLKRISVGRAARASYIKHSDVSSPKDDYDRCQNMLNGGHLSTFEHIATPLVSDEFCGNFKGWKQFRKEFKNESNYLGLPKVELEESK